MISTILRRSASSLAIAVAAGSVLSMLGAGSAFANSYNNQNPCGYAQYGYNCYEPCHQTCNTCATTYYTMPMNRTANVVNRALSNVSNLINAGSQNHTNVGQHAGTYGYGFWNGWMGGNQNADVNNNANTSVNSTINAFSENMTSVDQNGNGWQNANVDNNAQTNVNSTINAFSSNDTSINQ